MWSKFAQEILNFVIREFILYADDILACILGDEVPNLPQMVVDGLQKWCDDNKMRLNVRKCKIVRIGPALKDPNTLLNTPLEVVSSYKYLGIQLNNKLNFDAQWQRTRNTVAPVEYLLKQLRVFGGWSAAMLASAYRGYAVSHFTYSAVALTSTSEKTKREMLVFQNRLLRAAGLEAADIRKKFNLKSINVHIDEVCTHILKRILADDLHPITTSLLKNNSSHSSFRFNTRIARTTMYSNTCLQKFVRLLRNAAIKPGANENLFVD
jgi:hypothetical protein